MQIIVMSWEFPLFLSPQSFKFHVTTLSTLCNSSQVVRFRSLEKPKEDEFCLELYVSSLYFLGFPTLLSLVNIYDFVSNIQVKAEQL